MGTRVILPDPRASHIYQVAGTFSSNGTTWSTNAGGGPNNDLAWNTAAGAVAGDPTYPGINSAGIWIPKDAEITLVTAYFRHGLGTAFQVEHELWANAFTDEDSTESAVLIATMNHTSTGASKQYIQPYTIDSALITGDSELFMFTRRLDDTPTFSYFGGFLIEWQER